MNVGMVLVPPMFADINIFKDSLSVFIVHMPFKTQPGAVFFITFITPKCDDVFHVTDIINNYLRRSPGRPGVLCPMMTHWQVSLLKKIVGTPGYCFEFLAALL